MIDFYTTDGVNRHQCKMQETSEVNSQVVETAAELFEGQYCFLFWGVVTTVLVVYVRYGSYVDDG